MYENVTPETHPLPENMTAEQYVRFGELCAEYPLSEAVGRFLEEQE